MKRLPLILSILALLISLSGIGAVQAAVQKITGGDIRNGSITTKDLKNGTIKSLDIGTGEVESSDIENNTIEGTDIGTGEVEGTDIGPNQVEPSDLNLPPEAVATVDNPQVEPVTPTMEQLDVVGTYNVTTEGLPVKVTWSGVVSSGPQTNCLFQLRVNGTEPVGGGGEVFTVNQPVNVSTFGLFRNIPNGQVHVEVWAEATASTSPSPSCVLSPSNPGVSNSFGIDPVFE